jgi:hypothetical protein
MVGEGIIVMANSHCNSARDWLAGLNPDCQSPMAVIP